MHPEHHAERQADHVHQFEKRFSGRLNITYTDASYHPSKPAMVTVALAPYRSWHMACSIRNAETVTVAEEVATALALTDRITKVINDSQQATCNYNAGHISRQALHILLSSPPSSTSCLLLWAPAHESLSGNAQTHTLARDLSCRAKCRISRPASPGTNISHAFLLITYTDILQYY